MKPSLVVAALCLILAPLAAFAQGEPGWNKHSLGANVELSIPMDEFKVVAGTGYGGNVRYQYGVDRSGAFTATAGYLVWSKTDLEAGKTVQPSAFNFFLGGKYYVAGGLYLSLEGGFYFINYTYEGNVIGVEGNTSPFMLPVGLGFQTKGFELGVRYMLLDEDFSNFSFTLGYNFTL